MATEQDAARDRVLAARADLAEQLELLEASAREAIDIPAKVRRSPAKAAAVVGTAGFLAAAGPAAAVRGRTPRGPRRARARCRRGCCPRRSRRPCASSATTATRSAAALERDFAEYAKKASKDRAALKSVLLLSVARPLLGPRRAGRWRRHLHAGFGKRSRRGSPKIRERAEQEAESAREVHELADASAEDSDLGRPPGASAESATASGRPGGRDGPDRHLDAGRAAASDPRLRRDAVRVVGEVGVEPTRCFRSTGS